MTISLTCNKSKPDHEAHLKKCADKWAEAIGKAVIKYRITDEGEKWRIHAEVKSEGN